MKHDDIVLGLTKKKLVLLLRKSFGEQGVWGTDCTQHCTKGKIEEWNKEETLQLISDFEKLRTQENKESENLKTLQDLKDNLKESKKLIENLSAEESLNIERTFEFPLIKGEGQYKCTKGFIDLIVHCSPISSFLYSSYKKSDVVEFIIEIKKEEDFKDMGGILRQIKEYKEYYDWSVKKWDSKLFCQTNSCNYDTSIKRRIYCILSTKIPKEIKELFLEEEIICLEIGNLKEDKKSGGKETRDKV